MRALVFLLIFANLVFFAYTRGYFGEETRPDAQRIGQQIAPERLVVVSGDQPPANSATSPAPVAASKPVACLAWKGVAPAVGEQIQAAADAAAGLVVSRADAPAPNGFWVFIPPQANRAGAERKAAELRGMGVKEYFIVQDEGANQHAVSLGVFATETAAHTHLTKLRGQGVRSAVVAPRGRADAGVSIEVRGDAAAVAAWRSAWTGPAAVECAPPAGNGA